VNTAQNTTQQRGKNFQQLTSCDTAVAHKLCTSQIRTQTASLPPSLTFNSLN